MHVTDATCLENDETLLLDMTVLSSEEERAKLKANAARYMETVLNYNPDATEQIDTQDKHLACADNLGDQAREKLLLVFEEQNESCLMLANAFLYPYPSWLKEVMTGIDNLIEQINPLSYNIKLNRVSMFAKHLPGLSSGVRNYFKTIGHARSDCKQLVLVMDHAIQKLERTLSDLTNQLDDIKAFSRALYHAIEFGHMVEQSLSLALERDIPDDDPRSDFIESTLIDRFRNRIYLLRLQMSLNRECVITQEIHIRNCREMIDGIEHCKSLVLKSFNLTALYSRTFTGRRTIRRIWPDTYDEIKTMVLPKETQAKDVEDALSELKDSLNGMKSFLKHVGPVLKASLENKCVQEQKTAKSFKHMKQYFKHVLQKNLSELE